MSAKEYIIKAELTVTGQADDSVPSAAPITAEAQNQKVAQQARGKNYGAVAAIGLGKQALNYGLSNYGNLTGDYLTQKKLKAGVSFAASALMIAANPVVGGIATAGAVGLQVATTAIDVAKSNFVAQKLQERTQTMSVSGGRR